jgi:tryptophanase
VATSPTRAPRVTTTSPRRLERHHRVQATSCPTHQGRASERLLVEALIGSAGDGAGKVVPNNAHFDTTRANIEHSGAEAIDLLTEAARDPGVVHPFKGDVDTEALERCSTRATTFPSSWPPSPATATAGSRSRWPTSAPSAPSATGTTSASSSTPAASRRTRGSSPTASPSTRDAPSPTSSANVRPRDGATISAKKDGLVNIGGVLLLRDDELFEDASNLLILTEGFVTYGGLAGRDLEAMAAGFVEVLDEHYLRYRCRSIEYLGEKLLEGGIGIVRPPGGHAIYIDAAQFCPHLPREELPGQALACALYEYGGIRGCEIGTVMLGEHAVMELVRLAVPRRTYTQSHIDYVIEVLLELKTIAHEIRGMRITKEPKVLRHFTARFAPVGT